MRTDELAMLDRSERYIVQCNDRDQHRRLGIGQEIILLHAAGSSSSQTEPRHPKHSAMANSFNATHNQLGLRKD
jgi:hypothetical protein